MRRAPLALGIAIAITACGNGDAVRSNEASTVMPESFDGFNSIALEPASYARGANAVTGVFHYLVVDRALDWYVVARSLPARRAYRVVLIAADGQEYAIASHRSGSDGTFAAHGIETVLMNRECVGTEDPSRRSLAEAAPFRIALKSDGSPTASASENDLFGSRGALPCSGNGDGVFEYVLRSADQLTMAR